MVNKRPLMNCFNTNQQGSFSPQGVSAGSTRLLFSPLTPTLLPVVKPYLSLKTIFNALRKLSLIIPIPYLKFNCCAACLLYKCFSY